MQAKRPKESLTETTEVVLPNDTNPSGLLLGGKLLQWMDRVSVISAQSHSGSLTVTAGVDQVSFNEGVKLGEFVNLKAWVTRAFRTSMEVKVTVYRQTKNYQPYLINQAFFTHVALNDGNKPRLVPHIYPETPTEQTEYEEALKRREHRLVAQEKLEPIKGN